MNDSSSDPRKGPQIVKAADLAKRYGVSLPTIHAWVRSERIPVAFREGRVVRFNQLDCDYAIFETEPRTREEGA